MSYQLQLIISANTKIADTKLVSIDTISKVITTKNIGARVETTNVVNTDAVVTDVVVVTSNSEGEDVILYLSRQQYDGRLQPAWDRLCSRLLSNLSDTTSTSARIETEMFLYIFCHLVPNVGQTVSCKLLPASTDFGSSLPLQSAHSVQLAQTVCQQPVILNMYQLVNLYWQLVCDTTNPARHCLLVKDGDLYRITYDPNNYTIAIASHDYVTNKVHHYNFRLVLVVRPCCSYCRHCSSDNNNCSNDSSCGHKLLLSQFYHLPV